MNRLPSADGDGDVPNTAGIDRETGEDRSGRAQANRALGHHIQDSGGYGNPMRGCDALVRAPRSGDSASTFEEGQVLLAACR
jgi:hypothetical protein